MSRFGAVLLVGLLSWGFSSLYASRPMQLSEESKKCAKCHNKTYVEAFYIQYDSLIDLYNNKFAKPGLKLVELDKPLLKPVQFANKLDFIWFELWHHEGRRARHGASIMGPDYTHWHGTYEVAKHFYVKLIPELEHLIAEGNASKDAKKSAAAQALQKGMDEVLNTDDHKWYLGKMSDAEKKRRLEQTQAFKSRYK